MVSFIVFASMLPAIMAHSWITCPPSFNTQLGRGGIQGNSQCEGEWRVAVTNVEAGDRLKVGWTSNNHGGGYARISLVPWGDHKSLANFKANVMKFACYGHDTRSGKYRYGDCKHPCNGRPGCQYQAKPEDDERYDTTVAIPTNLPEGDYVLQTAMLVGNGGIYNSCAKLHITGGNKNFNCRSNKEPVTYKCVKAAGPPLSKLSSGSKRGDFCYGLKGEIGTVDDNMEDVPINVECDPRQTCGNSVNQDLCRSDFPSMQKIMSSSSHPRQPNCRVFNTLPTV